MQSQLYWCSFGEQPDWTRVYAPQAEILGHLERFVEQQALGPHLRLGTEVVGAEWSDDGLWLLRPRPVTTCVPARWPPPGDS